MSPEFLLARLEIASSLLDADRTAITTSFGHDLDARLLDLQTKLMIPDVNHFILPLVAYRHRHNIETGGYYLTLAISTRPPNSLFA